MSRPSVPVKKFLTEADPGWWNPHKHEAWCAIHGTTTAPNGRKLVLQRFFHWREEMDPGRPGPIRSVKEHDEDCKRESNAREAVYVHALHEVCKRRDGGLAFYGCELTIYAPRMAPIKVILEEKDFLRRFISPETHLCIVSECPER